MGTTTKAVPLSSVISPSATNVSTSTFAKGVLVGIKAPVTNNNIANVQRWLGLEQGSSAANWLKDQNNPLGVTTPGAGVTPLSTPYEGVVATVNTLLGSNSYSPIVSSLRNNAHPLMFAQSLVSSPWQSGSSGGSTYSGRTASQIAAMQPFGGPNPTGIFGQYFETPAKGLLDVTAAPILGPAAFTHGGATGFLQGAATGAKQTASGVSSAASAVTSIPAFLSKITNPTNLKNVGIFMAGMALTVTGLLILFSSTKQGQAVEGVATKAAVA